MCSGSVRVSVAWGAVRTHKRSAVAGAHCYLLSVACFNAVRKTRSRPAEGDAALPYSHKRRSEVAMLFACDWARGGGSSDSNEATPLSTPPISSRYF